MAEPGQPDVASQHFTVIFNAFVFAQVFNEMNSRKIEDGICLHVQMLTNALRNECLFRNV